MSDTAHDRARRRTLWHDGRVLTPDHGGPLRLVVPERCFEEVNGYHMRADPWREEPYADRETHPMQTMRAEAARRRRAG